MRIDMATTAATPNNFVMRLIGAAALDIAIYEEVEADRTATGQALFVVLLSSLAAGIGARGLGGGSFQSIVFISVVALMLWAAWALVTFEIGARLIPEPQTRADVGELLRTIGFAATPGLIRVLAVITPIAIPVFALSAVWMLAAMVVAVRQALDYRHTTRAIAVCVLGWVLAVAIGVVLGLFFSPALS
jgi:hypothetical protein